MDIIRDFYVPALRCAARYDRVAGYFRSSSLAAASQGFSALLRHGGKARLIVGADLDPADVAAVLAGEEARLTGRLLPELDLDATAELRQGVGLLAWLVAHGHLEVRVGLRVHAETGEPLPFNSAEDGYVHEKWGLVVDTAGDRLYFTGSLNESRTALVLNAENLDVFCSWRSEDARDRADLAERDFARLWSGDDPGVRVLPLPEAVRRRLVTIAENVDRPIEVDGTSDVPPSVPPPAPEELLRWAVIRDGPRLPGGDTVGIVTAAVTPWPHQTIVARRLVDTFPCAWLLCDEVGLGKTIEAGLVIRALVLSGRARRVLIAAPASLTRQWHRELASKFLLDFGRVLGGGRPRHQRLLGGERSEEATSLFAPDLVIVSTGLLVRQERQRDLEAAEPWDLVLLDEAHYARRQNPTDGVRGATRYGQLYEVLRSRLAPKTRCLLLATATPMQLDAVEAWDLMRLTRRCGSFGDDAGTFRRFYETAGKLAAGTPLDDDEDELLRLSTKEVEQLDPPLWSHIHDNVISGATRVAVRQWLEAGRRPRGRDVQGVRRVVFAAAPLSRVMLRHTRELLEVYRDRGELTARLPRRHILPLQPLTFSDQERHAYDALEDYCRDLAQQLDGIVTRQRARAAVQFYLSFLRLRFASSLYAIRETLRRRLERIEATLDHVAPEEVVEDDETRFDALDDAEDDREAIVVLLSDRSEADLRWERARVHQLLGDLADLTPMPSKLRALLDALDRRRERGRIRQTVVFTRFLDTLEDLVSRLHAKEPGMLIGTYSGEGGQYTDPETGRFVSVERDEVKHRFLRGEIDVLLCTDAAAEGLNLQTADLLVNYDLPWNPMKVEQRIGRIDRIGQAHENIHVLNLCYVGSAEEIVYGRLLDRLRDAQLIVGTQQLSLLPVTQADFAELAQRGVPQAKIVEIERRARERAAAALARSREMELPAIEQHAVYRRLGNAVTPASPLTLDDIWSALIQSVHLKALGCRLAGADPVGQRVFILEGVPDVPAVALTVDRELLERGIAGLNRPLAFATYGEPAFEALVRYINTFELPASVRRFEYRAGRPTVLYGVAAAGSTGATTLVVDRASAAIGLALDRSAVPDASAVPEADAVRPCAATSSLGVTVGAVLRANARASLSEAILATAVIFGLLDTEHRLDRCEEDFSAELRRLERIVVDGQGRLTVRLPTDLLGKLWCRLLYFVPSRSSAETYLTVPRWLVLAGLDGAWARLDESKKARDALDTRRMITGLYRRLDQLVRALDRV